MGTLSGPSGKTITLRKLHNIGRGPGNDLVLSHTSVSGKHALIIWDQAGWLVIDVGSRNGTFINNHRIAPGYPGEPLGVGCSVQFASERWVMTDESPPPMMAVNVASGAVRVGSLTALGLPDDDTPQVWVSRTIRGWELERIGEDEAVPVADEERVDVGSETWMLLLPIESAVTIDCAQGVGLEDIELEFAYSRGWDHLQVTVRTPTMVKTLPSRAHQHTLYALAVAVRDDELDGVTAGAGRRPRSRLAKMAGVGRSTFDQHLFRIRQELGGLGLGVDVPQLIVSEGGTLQLCVGTIIITEPTAS